MEGKEKVIAEAVYNKALAEVGKLVRNIQEFQPHLESGAQVAALKRELVQLADIYEQPNHTKGSDSTMIKRNATALLPKDDQLKAYAAAAAVLKGIADPDSPKLYADTDTVLDAVRGGLRELRAASMPGTDELAPATITVGATPPAHKKNRSGL